MCGRIVQAAPAYTIPYLLATSARAHIEHGSMPSIQKLLIVTKNSTSSGSWAERQLIYKTFIQYDCVANISTHMPYYMFSVGPYGSRLGFIRAFDREEIVSEERSMEYIAEGEIWTELRAAAGARLPVELATSSPRSIVKELRLWTRRTFQEAYPSRTCGLWSSEDLCNARLLSAKTHELAYGWSDTRVVQVLPPGFRILEGGYMEGASPRAK